MLRCDTVFFDPFFAERRGEGGAGATQNDGTRWLCCEAHGRRQPVHKTELAATNMAERSS